jgi:hypothetical protein
MDGRMLRRLGCAAGLLVTAALAQPAMAREIAHIGGLQDAPGAGTNGSTADTVPVGVFMVDQFLFQERVFDVGPGAAFNTVGPGGNHPTQNIGINAEVFIFNPGWTFLGASTDFIVAQPFVEALGGSPGGTPLGTATNGIAGMVDTFINSEAAWKFGDWHVKIGFGFWIPDGNVNSANGYNDPAYPFWTLQPEFVLSWEHGPWAITAFTYWEIDTKNTHTQYQNAPVFHVDGTIAYTIGKWTFGPVIDYVNAGITGSDTSSAFYSAANAAVSGVNCGSFECVFPNFELLFVGGLLQYNFGPVTVQAWATSVVYASVTGGTPEVGSACPGGHGTCPLLNVTTSGEQVWFQVSYALWTPPEQPAAPARQPLIYK